MRVVILLGFFTFSDYTKGYYTSCEKKNGKLK